MITKLVVKDYVSKKCHYLTKGEISDKTLIELIKKSLLSAKEYQDLLLDDEEDAFNEDNDEDDVFNVFEILKEHPEFKNELNSFLNNQKLSAVERLIDKYSDNQLISRLSRKYFSLQFGLEHCKQCDIDEKGNDLLNQKVIVNNTLAALKDPNIKVIFEGQIEVDDLRARFDVLIKDDNSKYTLYEVKATNNVCTHPGDKDYIDSKIKEEYLYDLLFQYYVYSQFGLEFNNIGYLLLNKNYKLKSPCFPIPDADLNNFFKRKITIDLKNGSMPILSYVEDHKYVNPKKPETSIEDIIFQIRCIDKDPIKNPELKYLCKKGPTCPFLKYCFKDVDSPNSIFRLTNWNKYGGKWQTTQKIIDANIDKISNIPPEFSKEYPLYRKNGQLNQAYIQIAMQKGIIKEDYVLDLPTMGEILKEYTNNDVKHLIFFDFESFQSPIPLVKSSSPYKQVVNQYSMHIVNKDYDLTKHDFDKGEGGGIYHREFIANPDDDDYKNPSIDLFLTLKEQLTKLGVDINSHSYKVIVFNKTFEETRMKEFLEDFKEACEPSLWTFVSYFKENIIDLLDFFTHGAIYLKTFNGKGSLKVVQPELVKYPPVAAYYKKQKLMFDLDYSLDYHKGDKCLVYNGAICLDLYRSLLTRHHLGESNVGIPTKELLEEALAYCKIDSWGTVIIYDIIKNIYNKKILKEI